jgi:hypothetical protein
MSGRCLAIANNDIVHIAWSFDAPLPECSGFQVFRLVHGDTGPGTPLRSLVAFEDRGAPSATPHGGGALPHDAVDPHGPPTLIKGFKWRDLLAPNQRGVTVRYRIVAMQGDEANATPLAGVAVLETAAVTPSPNYGEPSTPTSTAASCPPSRWSAPWHTTAARASPDSKKRSCPGSGRSTRRDTPSCTTRSS